MLALGVRRQELGIRKIGREVLLLDLHIVGRRWILGLSGTRGRSAGTGAGGVFSVVGGMRILLGLNLRRGHGGGSGRCSCRRCR